MRVVIVAGSATNPDVLAQAGIAGAEVLVACTRLDEVDIAPAQQDRAFLRLEPWRTARWSAA